MRADYEKLVTLANEGARTLGYADTGVMWRSKYDMDPAAFAAMTDKLWSQVMPFYRNLHCYVRARLSEKYGNAVQPRTGPIRADLLGNMWAQDWTAIYDIVAPKGVASTVDMNQILAANGYMPPPVPGAAPGQLDAAVAAADKAHREAAIKMMRTGEGFYSSIGFPPLPGTFWERTQFIRPRDREVTCHASAWDIDDREDLRIKMCIGREQAGLADDFFTVHHELGHNYYQRAYANQDYLFRDGANDGFHEAIGDFAGLNAITPTYLQQIQLLATLPGPQEDVPFLLRSALDGIAFLPFGLLVDKWRWQVFSGQTTADQYNDAWWKLVRQYQGVVPPGARPANAFDPGAKFHIPDSTPYMRYFLARVLEYQFYRAACQQAGWSGPLNRCSIYGNKTVGAKFRAMMEMGSSKPWPEALAAFTGQREIDATAIAEYFKPLDTWLTEQNKSESCGWQ
jgi:peptidyl-dipeptidase A